MSRRAAASARRAVAASPAAASRAASRWGKRRPRPRPCGAHGRIVCASRRTENRLEQGVAAHRLAPPLATVFARGGWPGHGGGVDRSSRGRGLAARSFLASFFPRRSESSRDRVRNVTYPKMRRNLSCGGEFKCKIQEIVLIFVVQFFQLRCACLNNNHTVWAGERDGTISVRNILTGSRSPFIHTLIHIHV